MRRHATAGLLSLALLPVLPATASWSPTGKLAFPVPVAGDLAGTSVAVSADGGTIVVGARGRVSGQVAGAGAVGVYVKGPSGWGTATLVARLGASNPSSGDRFGESVAVSADGGTIVVGAPGKQSSAVPSVTPGAAFVFVRPSTGWENATETARLTASDGANGDGGGTSVAVSSDGSTVVFGAPFRAAGDLLAAGGAYVFTRRSGGWISRVESATLVPTDAASNDFSGISVGLSSDGSTVAVGAHGKSVSGTAAQGAVYVYTRPTAGWTGAVFQKGRLTSADGTAGGTLGISTALSGDGGTIVAGAPNIEVGSNLRQGKAYVFVRPASGWTNGRDTASLTVSDGAAEELFGTAVAVSVDGRTVVAGAPGRVRLNPFGPRTGAAFVFTRPGTKWSAVPEDAALYAADGAAGDLLGSAIATSADGGTAVAGAPKAPAGAGGGAAYVFEGGAPSDLLLQGGNVRVSLAWRSPYTGETGVGLPLPQEDVFGYFSFGDPGNPEVFVKALDFGATVPYLVFYAGLTSFEYSVTFTNVTNGTTVTFFKPEFSYAGGADTTTLTRSPAPGFRAPLALPGEEARATSMDLSSGRVRVSATWRSPYTGAGGDAFVTPKQDAFGYLDFGDPSNPEIYVKVLDFGPSLPYLLFWGGLTDFEYRLTFTNLATGKSVTFLKPAGSLDGGADTTSLPQ